MSSREQMLARIRQAVAAGAPAQAPGPVPRDYLSTGELAPGSNQAIALLVDRLEDYRAQVVLARPEDGGVTTAVSRLTDTLSTVVIPPGLPMDIRAALVGLQILVDTEPTPLTATELDRVQAVVTTARVAIAATGTIVLDGTAGQGRRAISLVPDRHLVVLRASQVVQTVPEAIRRLEPTAPLTMISGPSATSDIELSRVEGVHGPRTLQVIIDLGA